MNVSNTTRRSGPGHRFRDRVSRRQSLSVLSYLFMLTHAVSCGPDSQGSAARFIVRNETGVRIDSILIEPDEKQDFASLEPGDSMRYRSEMDDHPTVDGSYRLSYLQSGVKRKTVFGYFSNGIPFERRTRIILLSDTVMIEYKN